jgi:hypothetical protein
MRKRDALRILKDEIEASLPKDRPFVALKEQTLFEQPPKPSLSLSFKRFAVSMVILVVAVSSFLLFGGIGTTLTTTTTQSSTSNLTTTWGIPTTTTSVTTFTTTRDKTPKDATSVIEHLAKANFTPQIGEALGLDTYDVIRARSRRFREPFLGIGEAKETILTDFDDVPATQISFENQFLFLESKGNEARFYVEQASLIVLLTDTWYHTDTRSYYMYEDSHDSYLIVTSSSDNYVTHRVVTVITARLHLENPEVTIRQDADYLDGSQNHHRDRFYIQFMPNWRYTYFLDNQDDGDSEGRRNAAAWEIRRDEGVITASSREESLPDGYVGLRMHQIHPTFTTEVYTDFETSHLLVYTEKGMFLQKYMTSVILDDTMPFAFGLASFDGWTSVRIVEEENVTIEAELLIGGTSYLFGNPQEPIEIDSELVFESMGPVRDGNGSIIDIQAFFAAKPISRNHSPNPYATTTTTVPTTTTTTVPTTTTTTTTTTTVPAILEPLFEDVLASLSAVGLAIDLPGVDTQAMIEIISDTLVRGIEVFDDMTIRGFHASDEGLLLISPFDTTWMSTYFLSQAMIEDILASQPQ